ncbi:LysM peptidoglycan-binding domain-containing protein [Puerhibacterium puerhi]|uniref:LysM peptidoglycan-binding domain-containing protein n=1 Tax=Puerhibacterium puerhi TaxID=2692623 RepID=UPI001358436D|nr:hypothetical protein [Puerhibacterium puerhi]
MTTEKSTDHRTAGRRPPAAAAAPTPARATRSGPVRRAGARLLALTLGAGAAGALLGARALTVAPAATGPGSRTETWVELAMVAVGGVAACWVALGAALGLAVLVAAGLGVRWRAGEAAVRRLAPGLVRRLVRVGVGVGVGAGLVVAPTTATAAETHPGPGAPAPATVDLGWQPTAPDGPADPDAPVRAAPTDVEDPAAAAPAEEPAAPSEPADVDVAAEVRRDTAHPGPAPDGSVVVHRGDTLWDIAARWLGGSPSDGEILAATVRWHEANRDVVGDDPDLVLPGQVLRPPA